jgi:hypothetical protein
VNAAEPRVAANADGRLEVFAEGEGSTGPELWHVWQNPAPLSGWSGWDNLGSPPGQFMGYSTVGQNADGRLEVFTRVGLMSTGVVWHIWQNPTPATGWSSWGVLGSPPGGVAPRFLVVGQNADGRLELFVLGTTGDLWHIWQQPAPTGGWSGWGSLGAPPGASLISLALGRNADGRLEAVAVGTDGALWHIWQVSPNSGWSGWGTLGAPGGGVTPQLPVVARGADGRLDVFATANPTALWHIRQDPASATGWGGWQSLGAPPGAAFVDAPAVGKNADGRLEVFLLEVGGAVWHAWQDPGLAGGWSGWDSLGGQPGNGVGVGRNADGRLEVFAEGGPLPVPRPLWHRWQTSPNNGWSFVEDWELTGPSGATGPALQLFTPAGGAVFVRTQTGLFRSDDAAESWSPVGLPPTPGHAVAVDPTNPSIIYAAGAGGLFKTSTGGTSWTLVRPAPSLQVLAVAVSPADHNLVYLALGQGSSSFEFLRSTNGGATWTVLEGPLPGNLCTWSVLILKPHPTDTLRVFRTSGCYAGRDVPIGDSLDQSTNQGMSWAALFHPHALFPSRLVGGAGALPGRFYLGAHFGAPPGGGRLFRSDDDGHTWTDVLVFPSGPAVRGLAYDPSDPDRAFAGLTTGVVKTTTDAGASWAALGRSGLGAIEDLALSLDGHQLYAASDQGVWRLRR